VSAKFQLQLITEPRRTPAELLGLVEQAVVSGVNWVQLRDKQASGLAMFRQAEELRRMTLQAGAKLSINDRLDVALAVGADGVHLAGQSLPVAAARGLAGGRLLVGRSVHSLEEAQAAARAGADYVTFGHVFPTTSKPGLPPQGVSVLAEIVAAVDVPVLAIGGINAANLDQVLATGCAGIALISAILSASDPGKAAAELRAALDAAPHRPRRPFPASIEEVSRAFDRQPAAI
jgi:thiamine-phosphate pyrophosphorylase